MDGTGAVRARYDYDPYGRVTKVSGDRDSLFLYAGYLSHAQSGLFLTLFRAYDPELGRWISRDPIEEEGGINLYAYVDNDPTNYVDPYGLQSLPGEGGKRPPYPPGGSRWKWNGWEHRRDGSRRPTWLDPEGNKWSPHDEDKGHWRHWDKEEPCGKKTRYPENSKKPWPGQKRPKKDQSDDDPNGDKPGWDFLPGPDDESATDVDPNEFWNPNSYDPYRPPVAPPPPPVFIYLWSIM